MAGFEAPALLVLLPLALIGGYIAYVNTGKLKRGVGISRTVIITLLVIAAATPYIHTQEKVMETPQLTVLKDESASASVLEKPELDLGSIEVKEKVIASGNSSDLKNGILRNLDPNRAYLMISDFQSSSSLKQLEQKFRARNATLNALKVTTEKEAAVTIKGPSSTVPGAKNRFKIKVYSTAEVPKPAVELDSQPVELERTGNTTWSFTETFSSEGSHTLTARIDVNDTYSRNDRFYHAIEVNQKPEILVVGKRGSIGKSLEKFYDITYREEVPYSLGKYYAIILKRSVDDSLGSYVAEGNGVVYTGDYRPEMDILPVKRVDRETQSKGAKVVLVIDYSEGAKKEGTAHKIRQIAYNTVRLLPSNTKVGAIGYNRTAYRLRDTRILYGTRDRLKTKIASFPANGPSHHYNGLKGAKKMLEDQGNILWITDGKITGEGEPLGDMIVSRTREEAATMGDLELRIIGVGEERNRYFLEDLAELSGGQYFDESVIEKGVIPIDAGGAPGKTEPVTSVNQDHFITRGLEVDSPVTFFDPVAPKEGADLLASSIYGKPFLTTWRYGLGRVAAFSGGGRDLPNVMRTDPLLVTRTVSWAVGDPKRKKERWLEVKSARVGEKVEAKASYPVEGFRRQGEDLYTREITPGKTGFHQVKDHVFAYNYRKEYEKIGYSRDMEDIVHSTGGEVYTPQERQEIIKDLKDFSNREVTTKKPVSKYLLALALVIFLAEVGARKVNGEK